jgi:hypothetical protein
MAWAIDYLKMNRHTPEVCDVENKREGIFATP